MRSEDRHKQDGNHDDVGTLLRLAGKRKPVPRERYDRVRTAAHEQWQQSTKTRTRRRTTWAVAGLLAAASLITVVVLPLLSPGENATPGADASIRVEALNGLAQVREAATGSATTFRRAAVGDVITIGTEFTTLGESRAALRLTSGHSMRLDVATRVRWLGRDAFDLVRGAIYVDSGPDESVRRHVEIRTPLGSVHDIGTQFEVRMQGDAILVRLREGSVVIHRAAEVHEVEAGDELHIPAEGPVKTRFVSPGGPEWHWVAAITPMPDFEGRSARSFLEWVARERGWRLEFTDEALAKTADEIVLDGSFSQLSLDQVLDAVLPTCRMTYQVEQGILNVDRTRNL